MSLSEVKIPFTFDPVKDLLGKGTVSEVFRATLGERASGLNLASRQFAVKRFLVRANRDDFENERAILESLAATLHPAIAFPLSSWVAEGISYILFPLAEGDLYRFIRTTPPPVLTEDFVASLVRKLHGLCDAISYVHEFQPVGAENGGRATRRIGFHHDIKPANILLFSGEPGATTWKLADFGSGAVKFQDAGSHEELYNRKASTGDTIYSAPEFAIEGRVSRPKDIWSLGGVFLEVLVWALTPAQNAVQSFEAARAEHREFTPGGRPTYWCQSAEAGEPYLNPAVVMELNTAEARCKASGRLLPLLEIIRSMLTVSTVLRPTAAQICGKFKEIE